MIALTYFRRLTDCRGVRVERELGDVYTSLERLASKPHSGRMWSPATFTGDYCRLANVERAYMLGVDLDRGDCTPEQAADLCGDTLAWIHATKSSTPARPRLRVLYPLARPVDSGEYYLVWLAVEKLYLEAGHKPDNATKDPSRRWYLPCRPAEGEPVFFGVGDVELDVDAVLANSKSTWNLNEARPEQKRGVENGNTMLPVSVDRDRRLRRARAWLARRDPAITGQRGGTWTFVTAMKLRAFGLTESEAFEMLWHEFNPRCVPPWREPGLRRKVSEAFTRGRVVEAGSMLEAS